MSNVLAVDIQGLLPFNCHEHKGFQKWMAVMNGPTWGIKLCWESVVAKNVPNEYGGETAMYRFWISGQEAVSWGALDVLLKMITDAGGTVERAKARDIENCEEPMVDLKGA